MLKMRNFFTSFVKLIFTAQQRLLIVLIDRCNRKNDMNFFVNILWIFSYPSYNSKIGFMTQHYVLENFHAPFKSLPPRSWALIMTSPLRLVEGNNQTSVRLVTEMTNNFRIKTFLTLSPIFEEWNTLPFRTNQDNHFN